jgi:hypothetical protein
MDSAAAAQARLTPVFFGHGDTVADSSLYSMPLIMSVELLCSGSNSHCSRSLCSWDGGYKIDSSERFSGSRLSFSMVFSHFRKNAEWEKWTETSCLAKSKPTQTKNCSIFFEKGNSSRDEISRLL